jgi:ribonuclease E
MVEPYLSHVSPDLVDRVRRHTGTGDVFAEMRVDEQLMKALDRKVYLPSGGSLVIDRTEAMTVIDVNTGKYVGKGGNLEETVTRNNLEAAEEIARQLRLRDLGGIIVVDFIDMVLESNRDLVVRRLVECLGRDRTKHQVAEVTSLGLVQMTRKRVGQGLLESFSETCEHCNGRGVKVHLDPVDPKPERDRDRAPKVGAKAPVPAGSAPASEGGNGEGGGSGKSRRRRGGRGTGSATVAPETELTEILKGDGADEVVDPVEPTLLSETPAEPTAPETEEDLRLADSEEEGWPLVEVQVAEAEQVLSAPVEEPTTQVAEPDPVSDAEEEGLPPVPAAAEPVKKRRRAAGRPAGAPSAEAP